MVNALSVAAVIFTGIWLTGFNKAHGVLYLPMVFLAFAGVTGICPGLIFWNKVGFQNEPLSRDLPRRNK